MEVKSAFSSALVGIRQGLRELDDKAFRIAHASTTEGQDNVIQPLVESRVDQNQVAANAKVIRIVDEALGSLLDEKA
jgi:hypothetical protein